MLYRQLLFLLQITIICLVLGTRVYALYDYSKRVLTCMIIIGFMLAAISCMGAYGHFSGNATILPGVGCYETYSAAVASRQ
ncbi:hypothetical protein BDR07DRAFT_1407907 [Suillus spraguei]|nr:hypothetical protein BDR07DRAFT_1407907 [Suillus spraguei]